LARHAQKAVEVFGAPLATVTSRNGDLARIEASAGAPTLTLPGQDIALDGSSPLAHVLNGGGLLVVPDLEREPRFAGDPDGRFDGLHFIAAAPVRAEDDAVLGVLALHDTHSRPFGEADRKLLAEMAQGLVGALQQGSTIGDGAPAARGDAGDASAQGDEAQARLMLGAATARSN
jgi:GAF domain-containing protein